MTLPAAAPVLISPELMTEIRYLFPYFSEALISEYARFFVEPSVAGDAALALSYTRQSDVYRAEFAGNVRDDGTIRMSEIDYITYKTNFQSTLAPYVNPSLFDDTFVSMLEGEKSYNEFLEQFDQVVQRVLLGSQATKDWYASNYGIELSDSALIASALDPSIDAALLNRQISLAEVGGTATQQGFVPLTGAQALRLVEAGINVGSATELFQKARQIIPLADTLIAMHEDPNDPFDLDEFIDAEVGGNPAGADRLRRLFATETAQFSETPAIARDRSGALTGLADR